jgi:nucleotide-binding universal stress UspA family protein
MARGFVCECATPSGDAAPCIVEEARLRQADLIAMTTHGRTGPGRWLLGSVAESVVAKSSVPVLLERAWHPIRREPLLVDQPRLLVPLDGSSFAEAALEPAAKLAIDLGARRVLLRVESKPVDVLKDSTGRVLAYTDQLVEQTRCVATDYLKGVADRAGAPVARADRADRCGVWGSRRRDRRRSQRRWRRSDRHGHARSHRSDADRHRQRRWQSSRTRPNAAGAGPPDGTARSLNRCEGDHTRRPVRPACGNNNRLTNSAS